MNKFIGGNMEKTLENLTKAFIGESQARNRYTFYSKVAKKEGFPQISELFLKTADNEREHAKWLFRLINELKKKSGKPIDSIIVEAEAPTTLGNTVENLKSAIAGEHYENSEMYPEFAKVAEEEGYKDIAKRLRSISKAEEHHEARYIRLLEIVESGTAFEKTEEVTWICQKCAYTHQGTTPPEECPSCDHATKYFEILCEEY